MKRVYVAGAYSAPNVIGVLDNMRRGLELSYGVLKLGYAPFSPWLDYQFALIGEVTIEEFYSYSLAWLAVSDAVIVVPEGAEDSVGTQHELSVARDIGLPVFRSLDELERWDGGK